MQKPPLAVVHDPRFREHVAPQGHPERSERLGAIDIAIAPLAGAFESLEPRACSDEEILYAHDQSHLEQLVGVDVPLGACEQAGPFGPGHDGPGSVGAVGQEVAVDLLGAGAVAALPTAVGAAGARVAGEGPAAVDAASGP